MSDIAHCHGTDCPQREECWRYKMTDLPLLPHAKADPPLSSWDADRKGASCDGYWPIKRDA